MRGTGRLAGRPVGLQESRQVTGDGRIGLERQAHLAKAGDPLPQRPVGRPAAREEAVDQQLAHAAAIDRHRNRAADQLSPPAEDRNALGFRSGGGQQCLLGRSARVPQGDRLPGIELDALFGETAGHVMGQGQVHVVAAHEQVIADRDPPQHQLALLLGGADERQIGRAAADVADQQRVAHGEPPPPALAGGGQPGVNGCLRLFEQHQIRRQPGGQGGLAG